MDNFRLIQIIHWVVFGLGVWLIYAALSVLLRKRMSSIARATFALAINSILFVLIEALLQGAPSKGVVFQWKVGAAGNFYIYVLLLLISVPTLIVLSIVRLTTKARS